MGVSVECVILFGSHVRDGANANSDIDLAVFSETFGGPDHCEFSGVLSEAAHRTDPMIAALGYHPSVLNNVKPISFLHEIVSTGRVVYQRETK